MCGRVICALNSDVLMKIAKSSQMINSMKYRKSYNIGPDCYLPGVFRKKQIKYTNREFQEITTTSNNIKSEKPGRKDKEEDQDGHKNEVRDEKEQNVSQYEGG